MKKISTLSAFLLLSGALQGCDLLSAPDRPAEVAQAKPTPVPTLAPAPTSEPIALPPEVEAGTGRPIEVEWNTPEASGPAAAPPVQPTAPKPMDRRPAARPIAQVMPTSANPATDLRSRCEAAGGKYYPPDSSFRQTSDGWTDVTAGQCQYPNGAKQ